MATSDQYAHPKILPSPPGRKTGKYIFRYNDKISADEIIKKLPVNDAQIAEVWKQAHRIRGSFSREAILFLCEYPEVETVFEEKHFHLVTQYNRAPWSICRVSSRAKLPNPDPRLFHSYTYDLESAGYGVNIIVMDTGVRLKHAEFDFGRRAQYGSPLPDPGNHGTHCGAAAAGRFFGVAKSARIVNVRISLDQASIVYALLWAKTAAVTLGRPTVVLMCFCSRPENDPGGIVEHLVLVNSGVHVVVAAGNYGEDARNFVPARVPGVITVAASSINDEPWKLSNFGPAVDLYAPGEYMISASGTGDSDYESRDGTSAAASLTAGVLACLISIYGNKSPQEMKAILLYHAQRDVLKGVPENTPNVLLHLPQYNEYTYGRD